MDLRGQHQASIEHEVIVSGAWGGGLKSLHRLMTRSDQGNTNKKINRNS